MRTIGVELRRTLLSPLFLLGILCAFTVLFFAGGLDLPYATNAMSIFEYARSINNSNALLAVAAAIPFAGAFCTDFQSGSMSYQIVRSSPLKYSVAKICAAMVSGGLSVLIGCLTFFLVCVLATDAVALRGAEAVDHAFMIGTAPFAEYVQDNNLLLYWVFNGIAQFFFGAFWSTVGLAVSSLSPHKYIAYASPFVFSELLTRFMVLYEFPYFLNPGVLATKVIAGDPVSTLLIIVGIYICYIVLLGFLFFSKVKQRIANA